MPPIMQSVRFGMGNTLALGILLGGTVASARECPAPKGSSPELASVLAEDRIRFLARTLTDTARRERDYAIGWSLTYAGLSAASWVMLPLSSSDEGAACRNGMELGHVRVCRAVCSVCAAVRGARCAQIEPAAGVRK